MAIEWHSAAHSKRMEYIASELEAITLFEMWDQKTQAAVHTFLTLNELKYIANFGFTGENSIYFAVMENGQVVDFSIR